MNAKTANGARRTLPRLRTGTINANESAELAWFIAKDVSKMVRGLPREGLHSNTSLISFDDRYGKIGAYIVHFAGTVVATEQKHTFEVPERTLMVLESIKIPYRII